MLITSPKNSLLREMRKAALEGRPTADGLVAAEGPHLLEEALRGRWIIEHVLIAESGRDRLSRLLSTVQAAITEVSDRAFAATAITEAHQGVIALLRPHAWCWSDLAAAQGPLVVLDGVQDPGNAGTTIRSAEAFGAAGVIFIRGSVRLANGKLLRASAGSAFRVPVLENVTGPDMLEHIREIGSVLYAFCAGGTQTVYDLDLTGRAVLVFGSEGGGISPLVAKQARTVRIPVETVESLNVGIAASIALFEAARQRRGH